MSAVGGREGDSFLSPEVQREKIEAWASYREYRVTAWYIDLDRSGREGSIRPEFERMMRDAADGRFEAVAVYRLTRFARSVADAARRYSELRKLDVALVSVTEDIDTTTASGSFMQNMLFAMAEFESQRIGEEWRNVHASRRRRGIAHVARPITGYRTEGAQITDVEPVEAQAVRKMYVMRSQRLGYGAIRQALQNEGYTSRLGKTRFSQSTISRILRNPLYAGLVRLRDGELIDATHEPIVPRELWEQVQALHGDAAAVNRHTAALLSGLLVCSSCGYRMHFEQGRVRPSQGGYAQAGAYRCSGKARAEPCPNPLSIHAGYVEDHVERVFLRRFDPRRMPHGGRLRATRQQKAWQARLVRLQNRVDELAHALDGLADQRYVKGTVGADEYERQSGRYLAEKAQIEEEAERLDRTLKTIRPLERDALSLWPQLSVDAKRRAFRLVIDSISVLPSPRKGRGQKEMVPKRLVIGWLQ